MPKKIVPEATTTTKKTGVVTNHGYNSRLQKGGALLEDMRFLVRSWQNGSVQEQIDVIVTQNLLGKQSRARARETLRRAFLPRFVTGRPREAWEIVRELEDQNLPLESLRPVYYWITARNESLLYDFVREELLPRSKRQEQRITTKEVFDWIRTRLALCKKAWSEAVTTKVAQGILATLRDFGVLEGATNKRISPVYVPVEAFTYISFAIEKEGITGAGLVNHQDWSLFLFSPRVVEHMFLEADRNKLLRYHAAGKIMRVDFPADSYKEMAHVIASRTD